jgi:iron complex outermembrane recepter protein
MKKTNLSFILLIMSYLLLPSAILAQQNFSLKILDADTRIPLAGSSVYWQSHRTGGHSNNAGQYTGTTQATDVLIISHIGYQSQSLQASQLADNQEILLKKTIYQADEVIVNATRASQQQGMAYSNLGNEFLQKQNNGQDLPIMLNQTASLVSTSDAGAGIGYTGMRIRGSDATRINVTVNGIPINDAESQGVYWVNMPDLASSVSSIQIQRGVGTSANGAGAFGASINIQSNEFHKEPYAHINTAVGSFGTYKNNLKLGSGLLHNKFTFDGRVSAINSDGYIDRASSNLRSYYLSGAYFGAKSFVRLNVFAGKEKTYQAWNGVPQSQLDSNRTYNVFTYPNQTDNYQQNHYQLLSSHNLGKKLTLNANLHLTHGQGYYEEEKLDESLAKYGIKSEQNTDLVRQKWLDNDFYGTTYALDYKPNSKLTASLGGAYNIYDGDHFGKIIWAKLMPESKDYRWYQSNTVKKDFNIYAKTTWLLSASTNIYTDLQYRSLNLRMEGTASKQQNIGQSHSYGFFNPKVGLNHQINNKLSAYASMAVGQKEPNRPDFVDNPTNQQPKPEKLTDYETGLRYFGSKGQVLLNAYYMSYQNQLAVTGQINDVGEPIRANLAKSYRRGIELEIQQKLAKKLDLAANVTLSQNKVASYKEYIPDYAGQNKIISYQNTNLAFSPSIIAGGTLSYSPIKALNMSVLTKYVGKQYMDNTSLAARSLAAYSTTDLRLSFDHKLGKELALGLGLYINNALNKLYENNGYTYSYLYENEVYTENFYYPQAGRNFMLTAQLQF